LDAFAASIEDIFNISEFSVLRAILEPTEIIRDEMPDGESIVCEIWQWRDYGPEPIFASWALDDDNTTFVCTLRKGVRRTMRARFRCTGENNA
jgi:hypothetical protein